ncbi:MAG: DUF4197 domain-containing protein [Betaproteobacteria bacterium]
MRRTILAALAVAVITWNVPALGQLEPPSLQRAENLMRRVGMGRHADELVTTLNRAAEAAVPEARPSCTSASCRSCAKSTERVGLAQKYNEYARQGVTQKALDGFYLMIAEEEKKIRKDPVQAGSAIVRKVFGAVMGR